MSRKKTARCQRCEKKTPWEDLRDPFSSDEWYCENCEFIVTEKEEALQEQREWEDEFYLRGRNYN